VAEKDELKILAQEKEDLLERCRTLSERLIYSESQLRKTSGKLVLLEARMGKMTEGLTMARKHCSNGAVQYATDVLDKTLAAERRHHERNRSDRSQKTDALNKSEAGERSAKVKNGGGADL
jgi:hypothetical protein